MKSKTFIGRILGAVSASVAFAMSPAMAQTNYPTKSLELVVGFLPGGATDYAARLLAQELTSILKQSVVVVNRPGANSSIAVDYVKRAAPDGYTLFYGTADAVSVLPAVKPDVTYQIPESLTFITKVTDYPLVLSVSGKAPYKTMEEFIKYAKQNPGAINYGTAGVGSGGHIETVRVATAAGIDITHVPYKGAVAAATDLVAGTLQASMASVKEVEAYLPSGDVRIIGVSSPERISRIPDVQTFAEVGLAEANLMFWNGLLGPANMPQPVIDRLNAAVAEAVTKPGIKDKLAGSGLFVSLLTGDKFKDYAVKQLDEFKAVANAKNIRISE